jgi:hypothetical protein
LEGKQGPAVDDEEQREAESRSQSDDAETGKRGGDYGDGDAGNRVDERIEEIIVQSVLAQNAPQVLYEIKDTRRLPEPRMDELLARFEGNKERGPNGQNPKKNEHYYNDVDRQPSEVHTR